MERKPASERLEFAIVYFKINSPEDNAVLSDLIGFLLRKHDFRGGMFESVPIFHFDNY